jgi:hypothetical protein
MVGESAPEDTLEQGVRRVERGVLEVGGVCGDHPRGGEVVGRVHGR